MVFEAIWRMVCGLQPVEKDTASVLLAVLKLDHIGRADRVDTSPHMAGGVSKGAHDANIISMSREPHVQAQTG